MEGAVQDIVEETIIDGFSSASSQEGSENINEPSVQDSVGETPTIAEAKKPLKWLIFKVPEHVREVDERAYKPKVVSIGPFNHDKPGLRFIEAQKLRFYNRLEKIRELAGEQSLENAMKELEEKTRECYSEDFENINSHDFVKMMTLDGCFIVELLRLHRQSYQGKDMEEPIFETRWMLPTIARDLLMLENQLPMFVLQKIFELTTIEQKPSLNELALQFFEPLRPRKDKLKHKLETEDKYPHLLALFHSTFVSRDHKKQPSPVKEVKEWKKYDKLPGKGWVHNAKSLKHAGVRFRKKSGNLLGMEFESGKLKIPTLFIDDGTGPLLRNLIAYEQSYRYPASCFSCLAVLLDRLVDTTEDIDILRDAGIIKQVKGGNEEVVNLLNSHSKHLEFDIDDCCITEKIEDVNRFYQSHRYRVQVILVLNKIGYLGWMILSVAIIQMIYKADFTAHKSSSSPTPCPCLSPCPSLAPAPSPL